MTYLALTGTDPACVVSEKSRQASVAANPGDMRTPLVLYCYLRHARGATPKALRKIALK